MDNKYKRERLWRWLFLVVAIGGLLIGGAVYRIASASLNRITETKIKLEKPLSSLPFNIMKWEGEDVSIPIEIQKIAGADDFLNRRYVNKVNKTDQKWVNVYVAYTIRPRTMLGHRPQICYPANGWIQDYTHKIEIITKNGRSIPCLLHLFYKTGLEREERFVLNYYVVNGQLTDDESVFSGIGWRTPNIGGNAARYAAQVQISSFLESPVRQAVQEMSDTLIDIFPR